VHPPHHEGTTGNIPDGNRYLKDGGVPETDVVASPARPNVPKHLAGAAQDRVSPPLKNLREAAATGERNAETADIPASRRPEHNDHQTADKTATREQGGTRAGSAVFNLAKGEAPTGILRVDKEWNSLTDAPDGFEKPAPVMPTPVGRPEGTPGGKTAIKEMRPEGRTGKFPPVPADNRDGRESSGPAARPDNGSGRAEKGIFREGFPRKIEEHRRGPGKAMENLSVEQSLKFSFGDAQSLRIDRPEVPGLAGGNFPEQSVMNQVRDGMVQGFKDGGRVRITLYPESLGRVDMDIVVRHDRVELVMKVDNEQVRQLLNSHVEDLKTTLQNQGWQVQGVDVSLQKDNDPADGRNFANLFPWQERRNQDQQRGGMPGGAGLGAPAAGMVDSVPETAVQAETTVTGLSIFA
jgi:hypothetical protein